MSRGTSNLDDPELVSSSSSSISAVDMPDDAQMDEQASTSDAMNRSFSSAFNVVNEPNLLEELPVVSRTITIDNGGCEFRIDEGIENTKLDAHCTGAATDWIIIGSPPAEITDYWKSVVNAVAIAAANTQSSPPASPITSKRSWEPSDISAKDPVALAQALKPPPINLARFGLLRKRFDDQASPEKGINL